jgi:hypothetical protein
MKKKKWGKVLSLTTAFSLMWTGLAGAAGPINSVSAAGNQDLVVTEIMPNNIGADDYEFFEIHNKSDYPLNLANYKFVYSYSDGSGTAFPLTVAEKTIDPGQTLVIWYNKSNKTKTDFLGHYQSTIDAESVLTFTGNGFTGMSNAGNRTIFIEDQGGNKISTATYLPEDIADGKSAHYKLPSSGDAMDSFLKAATPTVGIIDPLQVTAPEQPADKEAPVIMHEPVTKGSYLNDLIITANVTDNSKVNGVTLFYKQEANGPFLQAPMSLSQDEQLYKAVVPKSDLWSETFSYYIEATDGINRSKTETYTTSIEQPAYDPHKMPPLLVTEVVPDSTNVGKLDGYEFIEIYNNSDKPVNFKDYKIQYRYPAEGPEADLVWPSDKEDVVIPSKKPLIFWIINADNGGKTIADFNKQYGSQLVENENIVRIHSGGMANTSNRGIVITTNTGKDISKAFYNDVPNVNDVAANKGIVYRFPSEGSIEMTKISSAKDAATPGKLNGIQIPKAPVTVTDDSEKPTIEQTTSAKEVKEENNLKISFDAADNVAVKTVAFYYRTNASADFKKIYLKENFDDKMYHYTVYSPELIGKDWVEYFATASDGTNTVTTEKQKVTILRDQSATGLRLNVKDHDLLSGQAVLKATNNNEQPKLVVDNQEMTNTYKSMEKRAFFAFDVNKTNLYFKNGVTMGDEILKTFDDTINSYVTMSVPISPDKLKINEDTVLSIRSGTKVSPFDPVSEENRDDFYIKNVRLVLSDGTTIYDPDFKDADKEIPMGDGGGSNIFLDFKFSIPADKFNSIAYNWDTKAEKEGDHTVKAVSNDGKETKAAVIVDNSAPVIEPTIIEGQEYKGDFEINATINDAVSSVDEYTATLDGKTIELPLKTSSADLTAGNHELDITATDKAGNKGEKKVTFSTVEEMPRQPEVLSPKDGEKGVNPNPKLSVKVTDPTNDKMDVSFYQGFKYTAANQDNITITQNASDVEPPKAIKLQGEKSLTSTELSGLEKLDGKYTTTSSMEQFPYQRFEVKLDPAVKDSDEIKLKWNGKSLPGRKVTMYAWNHADGKWFAVDSKVAAKDDFQLKGMVSGPAFVKNGTVQVIVQDEIAVSNNYDYSFVWMSDTQYYSESYPHIYKKMTDWVSQNKTKMNIKYVFHTGDLVNIAEDEKQWSFADQYMKTLEDAKMPYGVLAGNHDVGHKTGDYTQYYKYFGENRFKTQDTFAGSYKNNRGHYDLISANGNDYIMLYMGWGVNDEDIAWMNSVLKEHPDRMAILAFHEYMLVSGNRSPIGNKVFEEVVVPNKNVVATLSGHYHDSETLISEVDDNKDGTADRKVYQMLADYQGGPEGGQGFLRLLQVNPDENRIYVKTYSPYLDKYNFYDPTLYPGKDEFVIDLGDLKPKEKQVATDYFEVDVFTNNEIGTVNNVGSGKTATVQWKLHDKGVSYGWYVKAADTYRGKAISDIWTFTMKGKEK